MDTSISGSKDIKLWIMWSTFEPIYVIWHTMQIRFYIFALPDISGWSDIVFLDLKFSFMITSLLLVVILWTHMLSNSSELIDVTS